jgi:hypothetical protein
MLIAEAQDGSEHAHTQCCEGMTSQMPERRKVENRQRGVRDRGDVKWYCAAPGDPELGVRGRKTSVDLLVPLLLIYWGPGSCGWSPGATVLGRL